MLLDNARTPCTDMSVVHTYSLRSFHLLLFLLALYTATVNAEFNKDAPTASIFVFSFDAAVGSPD